MGFIQRVYETWKAAPVNQRDLHRTRTPKLDQGALLALLGWDIGAFSLSDVLLGSFSATIR